VSFILLSSSVRFKYSAYFAVPRYLESLFFSWCEIPHLKVTAYYVQNYSYLYFNIQNCYSRKEEK